MCLTRHNLKEKPFQTTPDSQFIWLGKNHRKALTVLENGVFHNNNFIFITGDAATGKTTLINAFLDHLGDKAVSAKITFPIPEDLEFLNLVANEFNMNMKFSYNVDFLIYFRRFLSNCHSQNKKVLLIIDGAHRVDQGLLAQIQFLSTIEKHYTKGLKIIFVGKDEFINILSREDNKDLRRRITIHYRVEPLTRTEVGEYIVHRLKVAGHEGNIFTQDTMGEAPLYIIDLLFIAIYFRKDVFICFSNRCQGTGEGGIFEKIGFQVRGFASIGMVECWNIGIMGSGIIQYWVNGKICVEDKIKNG
ncbi:MAG: general secretion pathway protein A [Desulfobacteraceae bacterium Eth-SRB2]|nr:MAG: general secretion pathway protein A [Desulfobacteraceae bacterium Eth-SRB2]